MTSGIFESFIKKVDWEKVSPEMADFVIEFRRFIMKPAFRFATKPLIESAIKRDPEITARMVLIPLARFMIQHKIIYAVLEDKKCLNPL